MLFERGCVQILFVSKYHCIQNLFFVAYTAEFEAGLFVQSVREAIVIIAILFASRDRFTHFTFKNQLFHFILMVPLTHSVDFK